MTALFTILLVGYTHQYVATANAFACEMTGPAPPGCLDSCCSLVDVDADGDVDLRDFWDVQNRWQFIEADPANLAGGVYHYTP